MSGGGILFGAIERGWLLGFLVCSTPVLGALALSLIAALTGGRWGEQTRRVGLAAPMLLIVFLLLGAGLGQAYPWAAGEGGPGHSAQYLSAPLFIARGLVALAIWTATAWAVARRAGRLPLALSLLAHAVLVIMVGVDWILSLEPGWMASNFGMNLAAQQIAAGAALSAILAPPDAPNDQLRDLASLIIAGMLGVAYLGFMDYLVVWYGNLPDKVGWYLDRVQGLGVALILFAFIVGAIVPAIVQALPTLSRGLRARATGICALLGLLAYQLFLLRPALGWGTIAIAVVAVVVQAIALGWTARRLAGASARRQEAAHG